MCVCARVCVEKERERYNGKTEAQRERVRDREYGDRREMGREGERRERESRE